MAPLCEDSGGIGVGEDVEAQPVRQAPHDVTSYEIPAAPGADVHFPVPWARQPQISFLTTPGELRRCVERAGPEVVATPPRRRWNGSASGPPQHAPAAPRSGLLLGAAAKQMFANQVRNLEEDRIRVIQAVAEAA